MPMFARVDGAAVVELIDVPGEGPPLADRYHPDIVAACVPVPLDHVVQIGWLWNGQEFRAPPQIPAVVPSTITRRQLLIVMAGVGLITGEEALAAATTGAVPAAIDAVFADLPTDQALTARITWATMSVAERDHPLVDALILAGLATAEQVDALFAAAVRI